MLEKLELKTKKIALEIVFIEGSDKDEIQKICNAISHKAHKLCAENKKIIAFPPSIIHINGEI